MGEASSIDRVIIRDDLPIHRRIQTLTACMDYSPSAVRKLNSILNILYQLKTNHLKNSFEIYQIENESLFVSFYDSDNFSLCENATFYFIIKNNVVFLYGVVFESDHGSPGTPNIINIDQRPIIIDAVAVRRRVSDTDNDHGVVCYANNLLKYNQINIFDCIYVRNNYCILMLFLYGIVSNIYNIFFNNLKYLEHVLIRTEYDRLTLCMIVLMFKLFSNSMENCMKIVILHKIIYSRLASCQSKIGVCANIFLFIQLNIEEMLCKSTEISIDNYAIKPCGIISVDLNDVMLISVNIPVTPRKAILVRQPVRVFCGVV